MDGDLAGIFSRPMRVSGIGSGKVERLVEAKETERAGLAKLFGLPGIASLTGAFVLAPEAGGVIGATVRLAARVTQVCVVSLEEFEAEVRETASLRFVPAGAVKEGAEIELDPESLEGPDEIYYGGEVIDLGAVLAEQLALALDPYPRKPGAALPADVAGDEGGNAFSVLRRLRGVGED
jgi:hypothetical protein